ncbi:hypothetical protein CDD82_7551 [Ophiocordyceps australis]|uniref:Phenylacetate 2-hydroxylase n=1 Tax=Ophiocordyceps australis TaxID=1399860 RepID=A0A2C5XEQ3_9HYPO|nr:hypothetical protein CDD82_7551 [Ophiocordyceps australis]
MSRLLVGAVIAIVAYALIKYFNTTDIAKIKNLPEIPGIPIFGNLLQLGSDHARTTKTWARQYGPVFQARLGNKRVIFANSYDAVRHFWVNNQSALISRPTFHTFHGLVSSSQGFTIGTSPWDDSCKRRRKAAATALNKPATRSYMPVIDLESAVVFEEMLRAYRDGGDIDPNALLQRYALNASLTLNYGFRLDGGIKSHMLKEIVEVERGISNLRSTSNNWQDYIPLLRLWGSQNSEAKELRVRRDAYLNKLIHDLKENIKNGTDKPCITGNVLKDPEAKLSHDEIKSMCLTIVSAGLDTVSGTLAYGMAYLASEKGQAIQKKAYQAIQDVYPDGDAWERCLAEEKVPYVTALVSETLRYSAVIPISLPRESIQDITYENAVIPAGTTFLLNTYASNYDESRFKLPYEFIPERYLNKDPEIGMPHYGYGAGSRMCVGWHLANRSIYTFYLRLITAFEIVPAQDAADTPVLDAIDFNAVPTSLTTEPRPFKIGLRPRSLKQVEEWISAARERTLGYEDNEA